MTEYVTAGFLALAAIMIGWTLIKFHRSASRPDFDLSDLIMEGGRVSKIACAFIGSFALTTWIMVALTQQGKMTEGFFLAYGGLWITPIVARLLKTD